MWPRLRRELGRQGKQPAGTDLKPRGRLSQQRLRAVEQLDRTWSRHRGDRVDSASCFESSLLPRRAFGRGETVLAESKVRVHNLAKELQVPSKVIIDKCRAEGIDIKNHMHVVSAGLEATIREWFSEGAHTTTLEEAKPRRPRNNPGQDARAPQEKGGTRARSGRHRRSGHRRSAGGGPTGGGRKEAGSQETESQGNRRQARGAGRRAFEIRGRDSSRGGCARGRGCRAG